MSSVLPPQATLADLARADGKAERIGGRVEPRPGQTANAEPAVPGWRLAVDEILASP